MQSEKERAFGGFFARLTAYMLDKLILFIPLLLVRLVLWLLVQNIFYHGMNREIFFAFSPTDIILYVLTVLYFIITTYFWEGTPGKKIMRLKVVSAEDRRPGFFEIFFRETFGRFLSSALLCIGYIIIGAGNQKQALHDYLADTRVIYDI